MARRALSAARAADLLNFLAAHPAERFSDSGLSRRLDVNLGSMPSLLLALVECAFLSFRASDKTYGLGPRIAETVRPGAAGRLGLEGVMTP